MATAKPMFEVPFTVTLDGRRRRVVVREKEFWTEQLPGGELIHHGGRLMMEGQAAGKWLEQPKICKTCKQPSHIATPLKRAFHPHCEGWLNVLPDDLNNQVIFGVASMLDAYVLSDTLAPTPQEAHRAA
jgi:hypothetical protein